VAYFLGNPVCSVISDEVHNRPSTHSVTFSIIGLCANA